MPEGSGDYALIYVVMAFLINCSRFRQGLKKERKKGIVHTGNILAKINKISTSSFQVQLPLNTTLCFSSVSVY